MSKSHRCYRTTFSDRNVRCEALNEADDIQFESDQNPVYFIQSVIRNTVIVYLVC